MTERRILIIGAGIGGLSTGCYAQMNGYRTRILEMASGPGGVCTAWTRDGYIFDGCVHNLAGTSSDSPLQEMWRELGVIPQIPMRAFDEVVRVERAPGEPGEPFIVHADLDRLEDHMKRLSPADAPVIEDFVGAARRFSRFDHMSLLVAGPVARARALMGALGAMAKWGGVTLADYAERFSDPFLRRAFPSLVYDWPEQSMILLLTFLARISVGDYGWPEGGSLALSKAIADRYDALGGEITYGCKVAKILVEDGRAVGVRLEDGREERADIVVSNANGHATIFDMLGGRYTTPAIRAFYGAPEDRIQMGIHVSLGVARDLSREPHAFVLPLAAPVEIAGEARDRLFVEPFGFDARLAPPGQHPHKAPLKVVFETSYRYWAELARDPDAYRAEKARIADTVIGLLEPRFPGLRGQVEVIDVATPITTERFTGNGHGYRSSIAAMVKGLFTGRRLSQTLPGLKDFYMVGQWAGVAGLPSVAAMGRDVARQICRRDGRRFVATQEPAAPSLQGAASREHAA